MFSEKDTDTYYWQMAVDFTFLLSLKLLATGCFGGGDGGGGRCQPYLHAALLWLFVLKLPLVAGLRGASYADVAFSLRLFVFRLSRVTFRDGAVRGGGGRWARALRLFREGLHQQSDVEADVISP